MDHGYREREVAELRAAQGLTVEQIMDAIDSTSIELYRSEYEELEAALRKLVASQSNQDDGFDEAIDRMFEED